MTSNDPKTLQTTSNENDRPVSKKVKTRNSLGGGDSNDVNHSNRRDLIEKVFSSR